MKKIYILALCSLLFSNQSIAAAAGPAAEVSDYVDLLAVDDITPRDKAAIEEALMAIPASKREEFVRLIKGVTPEDIRGMQLAEVVENLKAIPNNEWPRLEETIRRFIAEGTIDPEGQYVSMLSFALQQTPIDQWGHFETQINRFFTPDMDSEVRGSIVYEIYLGTFHTTDELENDANIYEEFITEDMDSDARIRVLETILRVEEDEIDDFRNLLRTLLRDDLNGNDRSLIMHALQDVNPGHRIPHVERISNQLAEEEADAMDRVAYRERVVQLINSRPGEIFPAALGGPIVNQEAIVEQRSTIVDAYNLIKENEAVRAKMPQRPVPSEEFITEVEKLEETLTNFKGLRTVKEPQLFRLNKALDGLKILKGAVDGHPISSRLAYQGSTIRDVPRIADLFVLAKRLYSPIPAQAYLKTKFAENIRLWNAAVNLFGDRFEHIKGHADQGLALAADAENGNAFINFLASILNVSQKGMGGARQARFMQKLIMEYRAKYLEDMAPLIEAVFMVARGHNVGLNDPAEENRPACANGAQLNLLRAISESALVGGDAAAILQGIELEACDAPLAAE